MLASVSKIVRTPRRCPLRQHPVSARLRFEELEPRTLLAASPHLVPAVLPIVQATPIVQASNLVATPATANTSAASASAANSLLGSTAASNSIFEFAINGRSFVIVVQDVFNPTTVSSTNLSAGSTAATSGVNGSASATTGLDKLVLTINAIEANNTLTQNTLTLALLDIQIRAAQQLVGMIANPTPIVPPAPPVVFFPVPNTVSPGVPTARSNGGGNEEGLPDQVADLKPEFTPKAPLAKPPVEKLKVAPEPVVPVDPAKPGENDKPAVPVDPAAPPAQASQPDRAVERAEVDAFFGGSKWTPATPDADLALIALVPPREEDSSGEQQLSAAVMVATLLGAWAFPAEPESADRRARPTIA